MPSITYECEDCGHQEERELHIVHGADPHEDEHKEEGDPYEQCEKCGSKDITEYTNGIPLRDEGREDFHSDG